MEYLLIEKLIFIANENKTLALKYDGREYSSIKLKRCFPFLSPNQFISVIDSDSNEEIGIIKDLNELSKEQLDLANIELEFRYFVPIITKVIKVKEKRNFATLDVITNAGKKTITLQDIPFNINLHHNGQVIIKDVDGNLYEVSNEYLLSKDSNAKFIRNYI